MGSMCDVMDGGIECEEGSQVEKQTCMCINTLAQFNTDIRTHSLVLTRTHTHTHLWHKERACLRGTLEILYLVLAN